MTDTSTWVWGTVSYTGSVTPYHSINYDTNGGSISSTDYPTYAADGETVYTSDLPEATKPGYVFGGWEIGEDVFVNDLDIYLSDIQSPVYLKAVWEAEAVEYTLSYNANGGNGSMSSQTVTEGESTSLRTNSFTRDGYYFTGWNTKADGSGTSYGDGAVVTFTQDMLLYAQWKLEPNYAVVIPDGDEIVIDPETLTGEAIIGVQIQSVIPEDRQLRMSVNAGTHYDDTAQSYRLRNNTGGQYTAYELAYKGSPVNPGGSGNTAVLELADSDSVFAGFQNVVSVKTAAARTAGRHTDLLTFSFAIV